MIGTVTKDLINNRMHQHLTYITVIMEVALSKVLMVSS